MWRLVIALISLAIGANIASARLIPHWPYDKLAREADLIVIAKAEASVDTSDILTNEPFKTELVGMETKLTVRAVLKGKFEGDALRLLHFRLKGLMPSNGPMLVTFQTPDQTRPKSAPEYLLFLKRRTDGRFETVTGQIDPILSVLQLERPGGR